jgi:hypothetical protein
MKRLLVLATLTCLASAASAQRCNPDLLREANDRYTIGQFADAFRILRPCVPNGFESRTNKVQAFRLLALSSIASDSLETARLYVRDLLRADSRFRPDPLVEPPLFTDMVRDLKPKWYTWPWKGRRWYHWAGRVAIVGVAVGVPLLLRDDPLAPLPGAPGFPSGG